MNDTTNGKTFTLKLGKICIVDFHPVAHRGLSTIVVSSETDEAQITSRAGNIHTNVKEDARVTRSIASKEEFDQINKLIYQAKSLVSEHTFQLGRQRYCKDDQAGRIRALISDIRFAFEWWNATSDFARISWESKPAVYDVPTELDAQLSALRSEIGSRLGALTTAVDGLTAVVRDHRWDRLEEVKGPKGEVIRAGLRDEAPVTSASMALSRAQDLREQVERFLGANLSVGEAVGLDPVKMKGRIQAKLAEVDAKFEELRGQAKEPMTEAEIEAIRSVSRQRAERAIRQMEAQSVPFQPATAAKPNVPSRGKHLEMD